jgi:hypothetical protein
MVRRRQPSRNAGQPSALDDRFGGGQRYGRRLMPPVENMLMVRTRFATELAIRAGLSALAFAGGLVAVAPAAAAGYAPQDVGGWTVAASKDGKGCFVTKEYERAGATTLLLGVDLDGTNHLTVLNANWSIKPKDRLELTFRLSNDSFPKHFAVGMTSAGKQGFVTSFGDKFPARFAASQTLQIFRGDLPVERLSLEGSGAAVAELRRCLDVQRTKPSASADEKEPSDSIPRDPFAPGPDRKRRK